MIILRRCSKNFSSNNIKKTNKVIKFLKESPTLPLTSLGLSATGVYLSMSRNKQLKESSEKQLKAMEKLTRSLNSVDKSLEKNDSELKVDSRKKKENNIIKKLF